MLSSTRGTARLETSTAPLLRELEPNPALRGRERSVRNPTETSVPLVVESHEL